MPTEQALIRYQNLVAQIGRAALGALFPNDIDVYLMAIELTTGDNDTIDYFLFPIMPNEITKSEPKRTNIKASASGVTVLSSNSFIPQEIVIKGNFGRDFKILLNTVSAGISGAQYSTAAGIFDLTQVNRINSRVSANTQPFLQGIKSGFGAFKLLKAIIDKSTGIDNNGNPFKLYFYNLALGESYLVSIPPSGFVANQSLESNRIWNYTLNINVIAPAQAGGTFRRPNSNGIILGSAAATNAANINSSELISFIRGQS